MKKTVVTKDDVLHFYQTKAIDRSGKLSILSQEEVTTETYRRSDGESIFVSEKGKLRTETEKRSSGLVFSRTWQDGVLTSLMVVGTKRTTLVYFDKEAHF